jgi:hypothetical protein
MSVYFAAVLIRNSRRSLPLKTDMFFAKEIIEPRAGKSALSVAFGLENRWILHLSLHKVNFFLLLHILVFLFCFMQHLMSGQRQVPKIIIIT